MAHIYSFEKLETWNEARALVVWIYQVTKTFPPEERYGIVKQLKKASVSGMSNIAEGSARNTPKDKANFYQIGYSSIIEVLNQLIVSNDLGFLSDMQLREGRDKIETLTPKVAKLRNRELEKLST